MSSAISDACLSAKVNSWPYQHWFLTDIFPRSTLQALQTLKFPVGDLSGLSGRRELHNDSRHYLDQENIQRHAVCRAVAAAFQARQTTDLLERCFGASLDGTYLRLEYTQDVDGFWLEPHTDIGVKCFTMLVCLSDDEGHDTLGTDIYASATQHVGRTPFVANGATVFIPGDNTWHGFERRPIRAVRKSLIVNYVTADWRSREQLAFPDCAVGNAHPSASAPL